MIAEATSLKESLHYYFGFDTFKGEQEGIIKDLLNRKNVFVIMPTGGGKSMCYQLPALLSEGIAIIVSPLIALMKNQVDAIQNFGNNDSIAHVMNSSLTKAELNKVKEDVISKKTKLLYVAPESLTKDQNVDFLKNINISFFAIDEAHCISEWGHDFRPEYRRLKPIIESIGNVPIIALTATATTKVQQDIQKNLGMVDAEVYKASFNRPNLYYEIRPKKNVKKEIVKYVRKHANKSGIIYCLSRKKVEEIAELLQVNGIKAHPYHAGMDSATRVRHQDDFIMEKVDVIVATIAFGMGIDKPDVRFVIHHDIPKSLESYYQETGRAGRDGGEGNCVAFYSYRDIEKLEKFMKGKPVAEQEIGFQLLQEVVAYAETSMNRRKFILHYFGEEFDEINGPGAQNCDNSRYPKERFEGMEEVKILLETVLELKEMQKAKYITHILSGKASPDVKIFKHHLEPFFGRGKDHDENFWNSVIRQALVAGLLNKEIETYGLLKVSKEGHDFIANPHSITLIKEHDYSDVDEEDDVVINQKSGSGGSDEVLFAMLKEMRKEKSVKLKLPPYVIFQDPSLEDMAIQYPVTLDELKNITGVGTGKAERFGANFVNLIAKYVEENEIERPVDMVVLSTVNKSGSKVQIIRNIDRKLPFEDIAVACGKKIPELLDDLEVIIASGTKINIDYYINEVLDSDFQEEIFDYFMQAETDSINEASKEFDGEYTDDELRLMRLKFLSEVGN